MAITALCLVLAITMLPAPAHAHVLKTDGTIGAELHIPPSHHPIAGETTKYTLRFNSDDAFDLQTCDCTVTILRGSTAIATKPLNRSSRTFSENQFVFEKSGAYTLRVHGSPKEAAGFQPFQLDYTFRVGKGRAQTQSMPTVVWIGIAAAIGIVVLAAYIMGRATSRKKRI